MSTYATARGMLFGSAAESYERFRPGYPDEVVERTLAYAGRPVATALEVGAGTGKATRAFASRGVRVSALEPDPEMFAVLERETVGMPVTPVHASYEEYAGEPVDLVYAAAAWHWTARETRWAKTADLLGAGGVVALFGSPMKLADPELEEAVARARRPTIEDDAFTPDGPASMHGRPWPAYELGELELFTDVQDHQLAREVVLPQKEYVGYLSTVSAYLLLPPRQRQEVLRRITEVLPAQVRLDVTVRLFLGRRV
jgi:SAM-dependent methyltransferase